MSVAIELADKAPSADIFNADYINADIIRCDGGPRDTNLSFRLPGHDPKTVSIPGKK